MKDFSWIYCQPLQWQATSVSFLYEAQCDYNNFDKVTCGFNTELSNS